MLECALLSAITLTSPGLHECVIKPSDYYVGPMINDITSYGRYIAYMLWIDGCDVQDAQVTIDGRVISRVERHYPRVISIIVDNPHTKDAIMSYTIEKCDGISKDTK